MALTTRPKPQVADDQKSETVAQTSEQEASPSKGGFFARKKQQAKETAPAPAVEPSTKKGWGFFKKAPKAEKASESSGEKSSGFFGRAKATKADSKETPAPKKASPFMRAARVSETNLDPVVAPSALPEESAISEPAAEGYVEPIVLTEVEEPASSNSFAFEPDQINVPEEASAPVKTSKLFKKGTANKKSVAKNPKKKPVKQGGVKVSPANEAFVVVPLRETTFWKITAGDLQAVDQEVTDSYVSFSASERRFVSDKGLTYKEANERAMLETAQMVRLINHTSESKVFYTVDIGGVDPLPYRISPGHLALDRLLAKHGKLHQKGTPLISGFVLTSQDEANTLLVLYHVDSQGDIGQPEVSVNPRSLEFAISQFVAQRKINRKETDLLLFNNSDFLSIAGGMALFPNEAMVGGVPLRRIINYVMTASAVAMLGSFGWTATMFTAKKVAEHRNAEVQKEVKAQSEVNSQLLSKSVRSFAQTMSLSSVGAFSQAEALWREDYKVTMEAVPGVNKFKISMPLTVNRLFNGKPAASAIRSPIEVEAMLKYKVPEGCVRSDLFISGGMNEIQFTVDCQTADSGLSRFGND